MSSRDLIDSKTWGRWIGRRRKFLAASKRCVMCWVDHKIITKPEVVDHIIPHKGNVDLLLDVRNFQALCKKCHDSKKQREEIRGYSEAVNPDGTYADPMHPTNRVHKFYVK